VDHKSGRAEDDRVLAGVLARLGGVGIGYRLRSAVFCLLKPQTAGRWTVDVLSLPAHLPICLLPSKKLMAESFPLPQTAD